MSDEEDLRTEVRPAARFAPGEIVAGRYRIIARLGKGGMGEVFRAEDRRLNQEVALKFLPAEVAGDARMLDRLAAEVRVGRGVSHPNVCRLYDLVEADGLSFIAMEFVDGEDLASLLRRIGRLPFEKAVALTHDLCSGLAAAHDLGVIHRDLKPANIMIDGRGHARITDFGLALAKGDVRRREIAGTPAYMAPEQQRGEPASVRSDIYALGAVLFEMFTGRRLVEEKALPSSLVREINPELERVILACLEDSPGRRPASVHQVMQAIPVLTTTATPSPRETPRSGGQVANSIAVLPFEDLTPGADDSFSTGLAEEIISDLSKIRALRVISRGSAMRYRGAHDLPRVAEELQVAYLLTGSVRKAGEQLRLTANLVNGKSDEIIWSEKFKGSIADVFDIQETVARTVAEHLRVKLTSEEKRLIAERPISDPVAFEYYIRARHEIWQWTAEGLQKATELLQRASDAVGENALIYSAMAYAEWQYFNAGIDPDEARLARAEELARKIFTLEPDSHLAHRTLGLIAVSRGDLLTGVRELRRVLETDPNDVDALAWLCVTFTMAGRSDLAEPLARHLERIDPFSLFSILGRGIISWMNIDAEGLRPLLQLGRELHLDNVTLDYAAAEMLALTGDDQAAIGALDALARRHPGSFFGYLASFLSAALRGDRETSLALLQDHIAAPARVDIQYSIEVANGLSLIGEAEQAIDWLENGIRRGFTCRAYFSSRNLLLANAQKHPRFQEVLDLLDAERAKFDRAISAATPAT
jgi:serine/threonine protein kinase